METPQDSEQHNHASATPKAAAPPAAPSLDGVGGDGAGVDPAQEKELWAGRTSWKHFCSSIAAALGWFVVAVIIAFRAPAWLGWSAVVLALVGWLYVAGRIAYVVLSCRYRLTNQRLFINRGILSKTIDQTELIRVDDVRVQQSLFDRLCGLGSVDIMSTDVSDSKISLVGIQEPERIADLVRQNMRALRRKSLFIENL